MQNVSKTATVRSLGALAFVLCLGATWALGGCAADEPVGHTKSTTKTTVDTPQGTQTTTETHEKDTKVYPK